LCTISGRSSGIKIQSQKKESLLQTYVEKQGDRNGAQYAVGLQAAVGILEKVDLLAETCSCMYMQKHKIPCRNFIKAMICDMEIDDDRNLYILKDYFHSAYLVEHVYAVVLQASNLTVPDPRTIRSDDIILPPPKPMTKASPGRRRRRRFHSFGESPGGKASKPKT
jgi:hypothetical protein